MVEGLMLETMPFSTASLARSADDQRDSGFPYSLGRVQARAVAWALCAEGKKTRDAGTRRLRDAFLLAPALAPLPDHPRGASHLARNGFIGPIGVLPSQEQNLGAQDLPVRGLAKSSRLAQLLQLFLRKLNGNLRLWSAGHLPNTCRSPVAAFSRRPEGMLGGPTGGILANDLTS